MLQAEIQAAIESAVARTQGSLDQLLAQAAVNEGQTLAEDGQFSDENSPLPGGTQSSAAAFNTSPKKRDNDGSERASSPSKAADDGPQTGNDLLALNTADDGVYFASNNGSMIFIKPHEMMRPDLFYDWGNMQSMRGACFEYATDCRPHLRKQVL